MNNTPVLVIIFNRPDFAQKLYNVLEKVKPCKLYVISDGGRNDKEIKEVNESRRIFKYLNWDCEVVYDYSEVNLGLRKRISGGISNVFKHEEKLIILEDDCIPHLDFFTFCNELLIKYRDDKRIMTINGCNLNPSVSENLEDSYFFTKYSNSWGWATWKRAWELYDSNLDGFNDAFSKEKAIYSLPFRYRSSIYWKYKLNKVANSQINSWAYRWMYSLWLNNGLAIVPKNNLIQNIGNDDRSSNTKGKLHYLNIETTSVMHKEINHPKSVNSNLYYDKWLESSIYSKSFRERIIWGVKKLTFQI